MMPAVGKSGAGMSSISSSMLASGLRSSSRQPSTTSLRLCGGMLVAMPTAMPPEPLTSRLGTRDGSTVRLALLAVVVGDEIDRLLVDVGQQLGRRSCQAALGVAHGRRVVAVDRAEVALAVDQRVAQREVLRHAHQRVVDRRVAVRVVLAEHVADHARALDVGPVPDVVGLVHGEEHAPVHRLEAVAHVRQRAPDDHAHGVVEVRAAHLLFEGDGQGFLGERIHGWAQSKNGSDGSRAGAAPPAAGPIRASAGYRSVQPRILPARPRQPCTGPRRRNLGITQLHGAARSARNQPRGRRPRAGMRRGATGE